MARHPTTPRHRQTPVAPAPRRPRQGSMAQARTEARHTTPAWHLVRAHTRACATLPPPRRQQRQCGMPSAAELAAPPPPRHQAPLLRTASVPSATRPVSSVHCLATSTARPTFQRCGMCTHPSCLCLFVVIPIVLWSRPKTRTHTHAHTHTHRALLSLLACLLPSFLPACLPSFLPSFSPGHPRSAPVRKRRRLQQHAAETEKGPAARR